jgi:hypothetical protein
MDHAHVRGSKEHKSEEATMSTTFLAGTGTTSAPQEEAAMSIPQQVDELEVLRVLMSHYAQWGDTQQWDKFGSLFHDDAVVIIDAGPRPDPQSDPRVEIHGREAFIAAYTASLEGVRTAHDFFLPEITIDDDTHAHAIWGIHDYIKTPVVNFNGYGHISHDYVKVDGQWKIIRLHTTRMIVDEEWLT